MAKINGFSLALLDIIKVSRNYDSVSLDPSCLPAIHHSKKRCNRFRIPVNRPTELIPVLVSFLIKPFRFRTVKNLNRNLIISHAIGYGDDFSEEIVRAAMLIRANSLAKGFSGVRVEIIQTLLDMLNKKVTPVVKNKGSLGSSGDLCMLSQLALVFTRDDRDGGK